MKKATYLLLLLAIVVSMFTGCGEDRRLEYYEKTEENQWIFSKMQEVYLWRENIKEPSRSAFFSKPSKFFSTLLYSGDKASFFTDTVSAGSYGITFTVMRDPIGKQANKVYALVLMVEPGSPADVAGIERGTWISSVGGTALTMTKYSMLQSGESTNVVTEYIDYDDETQGYLWIPGDTLQLPAATDCIARSLYLDSVYTVRDKNIGYLVLNSFNGDNFINETQEALLDFVASNVSNVIIDLRYCSGGSIANAASLASSFVEPGLFGTTFCNLLDAAGEVDTTYCYTPQQTTLCDKTVYIVTGAQTAGVAELFVAAINNARTMYDVITFGAKTKGVNVVTDNIQSPYGFVINPATGYIALDGDELLSAVSPDLELDELQQTIAVKPLGNEQEYILFNLFYYSINGVLPE